MTEIKRCEFDNCHDFEPGSAIARYCPQCHCARKEENRRRRLETPVNVYDAEAWEMEERRKLGRAERARAKNKWILANKSFCTFDIETTNLDANIGEILCAVVRPRGGRGTKIFQDIRNDANIVAQIRDELEKYDYTITFFGTRFDIPYLNTRLLLNGERPVRLMRQVDMYYTARWFLKLHSNRLAVVDESLFGKTRKTRVIGQIWNRAARGDEEAMKYIVDHCEKDVKILEDVFEELVEFRALSNTPVRLLGDIPVQDRTTTEDPA